MSTTLRWVRSALTSGGLWVVGVLVCAAQGAVPVSLPAGEDPGEWSSAFDLAGLEVAERDVVIEIRLSGTQWELYARDLDGVLRRATVEAPHTQAEREEVAAIAQGIARAVGVADTPPEQRPEFLPPPSPLLAPSPRPAPEPAAPAPAAPAPAAPEPVAPEPTVPLEQRYPKIIQFVDAEPSDDEVVDTARPEVDRAARRERWRVAVPPFEVGNLVGARPGVVAGPGLSLGLQLADWRGHGLYLDLAALSSREITNAASDGIQRRVATTSADFGGFVRVTPRTRAEGFGGLSLHTFRQQFRAIDQVFTLYFGLGTSVLIANRWGWGVRLRLRGLSDLTAVELLNPNGTSVIMPVVEGRLGITVQFPGFGDPFREEPTLPR